MRLAAGAFEINAVVDNRSEAQHSAAPMPFNFGLHADFNRSGRESIRFQGLPSECLDHLSMRPASTAEQVARLASGIDLLARPAGPMTLLDQTAATSLDLQLSDPLDLVVPWAEPPRPMIGREPWTSPRQSLLSGDRKRELPPGGHTRLQMHYACSAASPA